MHRSCGHRDFWIQHFYPQPGDSTDEPMNQHTKSAIDAVILGCDRGNTALDEWRRWRADNPSAALTECFDWILEGQLTKYNDSLATDAQIIADTENPSAAFFADSMDMYTLDITIIGTALGQLVDEGSVDTSAKQFVEVALKRQSHPAAKVQPTETIDLIREAVNAG